MLEKAKFLLRLSLLVAYWKQQQQQQHQQQESLSAASETASADYGIMLDGGLYHSHQSQETVGIPWDRARDLQRRRNYVGERTGWKAHEKHNNNSSTTVPHAQHARAEKVAYYKEHKSSNHKCRSSAKVQKTTALNGSIKTPN